VPDTAGMSTKRVHAHFPPLSSSKDDPQSAMRWTVALGARSSAAHHGVCSCAQQLATVTAQLAIIDARLASLEALTAQHFVRLPVYTEAVRSSAQRGAVNAEALRATYHAPHAKIAAAESRGPLSIAMLGEVAQSVHVPKEECGAGGAKRTPTTAGSPMLRSVQVTKGEGGAGGGIRTPRSVGSPMPIGVRVTDVSVPETSTSPLQPPGGARAVFPSFIAVRTFENLWLLGQGKMPGFLGRTFDGSHWTSEHATARSKLHKIYLFLQSLSVTARERFTSANEAANGTVQFTKVYNTI
jgi:hypothetical protein